MAIDIKNDASLGANLAAYYKLDESSGNASDATGNGWTLTNSNAVYSSGKIGNCVDGGSNNTNRQLYADTNTPFGISLAQFKTAWSISIWTNLTTNGNNKKILGLQSASTTRRANCSITLDATNLYSVIYDGTSNAYNFYSNFAATAGTWKHIVITYDGTNLRCYVDNDLKLTQARTISDASASDSTTGGCAILAERQNQSTYFGGYSGLVDEVGIWTKALTQDDITALYNGGNGLPYEAVATGTNMKINIGDSWKDVSGIKINVGDSWKTVSGAKVNIGDTWKTIF